MRKCLRVPTSIITLNVFASNIKECVKLNKYYMLNFINMKNLINRHAIQFEGQFEADAVITDYHI